MSNAVIPITDEQATLGQEAVKALRDLGGFFGRALGTTPEDLVGYLFGDRLKIRRAENFIRTLFEAKRRLEHWGVEEPRPASLSLALPIIEAAADEDREDLVDLYARLLANAMDPKIRHDQEQIHRSGQEDGPDGRAPSASRSGRGNNAHSGRR